MPNTSKGAVTLCNFPCNLARNAIASQVARIIAQRNIPCNGQKPAKNVARAVAETEVELISTFRSGCNEFFKHFAA